MESEQGHSELPRVDLENPVPAEVDLVHGLQQALLTHPVASQAAFSALVAEGRRFAETADGRAWRDRLVNSALLRRVRLVFDLSTLGLLEEGATGLPSNYLDALFMMAASGDTDAVLNHAYWGPSESDAHGRAND